MSSLITKEMSSDKLYGEAHITPGMQSIAAGAFSVRPKLPSITGSRFWAAFLVFLFHYI